MGMGMLRQFHSGAMLCIEKQARHLHPHAGTFTYIAVPIYIMPSLPSPIIFKTPSYLRAEQCHSLERNRC